MRSTPECNLRRRLPARPVGARALGALFAVFTSAGSGCSEYTFQEPQKPADPTGTTEAPPTTSPVEPTTPVAVDTGTPATTETTPPATTEPVAEAAVYANTSTELFEIEPQTGVRTLVGAFHDGPASVFGMVDIAIDLTGRIYGGTFDALYQIDPLTASLSKVCDTDLQPYALAFTSDGVLFAGAGADIVEVDLSDCSTARLSTGTAYSTSGDLVGLPDGFLYWTVLGVDSDELVRVDPLTGATFWVGVIDESKLFGLGYDEDELYGFSSNGTVVSIDPLTAATAVISVGTPSWWGATTNPVVW